WGGRDGRAVCAPHAGRAGRPAAPVAASAGPWRAVPRLPVRPRRRRPGPPRARAGLRGRLHGASRGQRLVRAPAGGQPQPGLLRDDARAVREESESLPSGAPAMRLAATLGAALLLGGCVTVPTRPELLAPSRARAKSLERDGQLRPALLEWRVARAIDPNDAEARAHEARLTARIEELVATKVGDARAALQRGTSLQARQALLSALALDPSNSTAAELLRGIGDIEFASYTVRTGDTLASIAERYYGDRTRAEVIWATNRLPPGKPLVVGAVLRIPEIRGVPFYALGRTPPATVGAVTLAPRAPERPAAPPPPDEPPEINPLLADVRDAVDRKEFASALADLDRFLADN